MCAAKFRALHRDRAWRGCRHTRRELHVPCRTPHCHAPKGIAGVDADADNIAGMDGIEIHLLQGFVGNDGVATGCRRGGGQNVEPARSDHANAE